jgi:hypothetical protein
MIEVLWPRVNSGGGAGGSQFPLRRLKALSSSRFGWSINVRQPLGHESKDLRVVPRLNLQEAEHQSARRFAVQRCPSSDPGSPKAQAECDDPVAVIYSACLVGRYLRARPRWKSALSPYQFRGLVRPEPHTRFEKVPVRHQHYVTVCATQGWSTCRVGGGPYMSHQ